MLTKVCLVKGMVFAVVMYASESWTIKKAEHQSIDAFELWYWRRLLRVPWTARRWNQSIIKEISPEYSLGGLMEVEAPILWPLDAKNWLLGKDPEAGKDWRQEEKGMTEGVMVRWHHRFDGHEFKQAPAVCDGQGSLACCSPWGSKESDTTECWTELKGMLSHFSHVRLFVTHGLFMWFSSQEYWSGLPCPPPGVSFQPRYQIHVSYVSYLGRQILYCWHHWEASYNCC